MKIKINNRFFEHFIDLKLNFSLDTFASTFSFRSYFNPDNEFHKQIFKPLTYPKIEIFDNENNILLTGYIVNNAFTSTSKPELITVSGYSKSGILEDVSIPLNVYPLEKNNQSLAEISQQLIIQFQINQVIDSSVQNEVNIVYEKAVAQPTESVASFLVKLASQRNIIISHNSLGDLLYFKLSTATNKPKRSYNQENVLSSKIAVNGRGFHSSISVLRQPSDDNEGVSTVDSVVNNNIIQKRSLVKTLSSGEDTDVSKASNNVLASELKALQLQIDLENLDYELKCGDIIEFQNKELFIYQKQKFIVSEIVYSETASQKNMSLKCLLPEAYSGEQPKNIFQT